MQVRVADTPERKRQFWAVANPEDRARRGEGGVPQRGCREHSPSRSWSINAFCVMVKVFS